MKTLSKKHCPQCLMEFEFESWNKNRIFCSRTCKDIAGRGSRISKEEWVIRAKEKHGDKYDYSATDIQNKKDNKVSIICSTHGIFEQDASQHILGKGCKLCANVKQIMTTAEFIQKASITHNNKYDYSLAEYKNKKEHVKIVCPKHGVYKQTPFQHLYHKAGCHTCAQIYTTSKGEIEWLNSLGIPDNKSCRQVFLEFENKKFWVDGLYENIIYEYLGDYWHGNPAVFSPSDFNKSTKQTYGELYNETLRRFSMLEKQGYKIKYIWESEWLKK